MRLNWRYLAVAAVPAVLAVAALTYMVWPQSDTLAGPATSPTTRTVEVGMTTPGGNHQVSGVGGMTIVTSPDNTATAPIITADTITVTATNDPTTKITLPRITEGYRGHCENGQPVVTYTPAVTRSGWTEIRPDCKGSLFGNLVVDLKSTGHYIGPKPGESLISDVR